MSDQEEVTTNQQLMEKLTNALNDSRGRTEIQLSNLERKLDQLSRDLIVAEAEIRKELQTQFVTKAEYEPRNRATDLRFDVYDKHMKEADQQWRDEAVRAVELHQLQEDIKDLDTRQRGATARAIPWIAVIISFLGVAFQILQHVQFR